tara:strand:- start:6223 stop:7407 length:1185 start_codon:yes stop_codon:yes gene_type:complete
MAIALYPGAFKPPHKGHFEVVKKLLSNSYNGQVYDINDYEEKGLSVLKQDKGDKPTIDKVIIFAGGGERNGITKEEAHQIWEIYSKYLPGVVVEDGQKNPMFAAKDYAKANPQEEFYAITGIRGEEDLPDLKRVTTFKNVPNAKGLAVSNPATQSVRATNLRNIALKGSLDDIRDFFPKELDRKELLTILNALKSSIIQEEMSEIAFNTLEALLEDRSVKQLPSKERERLGYLYNKLQGVISTDYYDIDFNQNHIRISLANNNSISSFDFKPFMSSLLEYMIDEGMEITPLPEIKIKKDISEAQDFFGRTAYYSPAKKELVLFIMNRHPKDIMRSFSHEMIHHMQNLQGRLGKHYGTNTNEDDALKEIEKEAYLLGNITFRNWEDKIKNEYKAD